MNEIYSLLSQGGVVFSNPEYHDEIMAAIEKFYAETQDIGRIFIYFDEEKGKAYLSLFRDAFSSDILDIIGLEKDAAWFWNPIK